MPRRLGRAAARRASAKLGTTPKHFDEIDDEAMPDVNASEGEPQPEPAAEEEENAESGEEHEENQESDGVSAKSPSPPPEPVIRKRRLGRPPKNAPPDWHTLPIESSPRDPNDPPRRRGRGGWRGRGGRKGAPHQPTQQAIDKEGNVVDIVDDELALPEDPEGETKVDKMGHLQDGREYRCRTFTIAGRGDRLYMLSTEPARCVGFRDSYLFFTKHKRLYKIIVDDEAKRDMIERDIIPHSYKGRAIGVVTARSVFREFGALIVVGGKKITDDYEVAKARAEGVVEGEIADPNDKFVVGEEYNKNQYVAWHGASSVYHYNPPPQPTPGGRRGPEPVVKKRRVNVTDVNWQLEHAREASRFNAELGAVRRHNLNGVYDVHTNVMLYPAIMQPTHARFEQVDDTADQHRSSEADDVSLPRIDPRIPRNFTVIDTYMTAPSTGVSSAAYEERGGPAFLAEFQGLSAVADDIIDELPPECREAFEKAAAKEKMWKSTWGPETTMGHRRDPIIDAAIVPYCKVQA